MEDLVDIITLENLEQKLPRWDPSSTSHLYALVDMGSNGIRFSISDLSPPRARLLNCVYRERAAVSLFDALSGPSLLFPDETIRLVSQTLARFWTIAVDDYRVPPTQVHVFATEAMRRAQNATAMLEAIRAASPGLPVYILAPEVETLFGAVGARSGFANVQGLFLDLGGGSVQMTYLDTYAAGTGPREEWSGPEVAAALAGQSLPFGAARLIRILDGHDAAVQATEISKLRVGLNEAFKNLCARFPSLAAAAEEAQTHDKSSDGCDSGGIDVYLCGGGFRGYGSLLKEMHPIQPYPIPSIGSFTVPGSLFRQTEEMLRANRTLEGKVFGMSKRRRAQFPAIVAVVEALIAAVPRIRSVTFCSGGNREGALMMSLPSHLRECNPLTLESGRAESPVRSSLESEPAKPEEVLDTLRSAFPRELDLAGTTTIFGLQLGALYTNQICARLGEDPDTNASAALHSAITLPDQPGLTHLARSVLGVTLCARWGANLAPIDRQLHLNLRALMAAADPNATFWSDYTGAVTAALAMITRWPVARRPIKDSVRFQATAEHGKKYKIYLEIFLAEQASRGVDRGNLLDLFRPVMGQRHDGKKVTVTIKPLS